MQRTIKSLVNEKGSTVWTIGPDATLFEAVSKMSDKGIGALLVVEGEQIAGILSERDYTRKVALHDRSDKAKLVKEMQVKEIMTLDVICICHDRTVEEGLALMLDRRIRHLPVKEEKEMIGMVTIGDLAKAIIEEKGILIDQLERFICGH